MSFSKTASFLDSHRHSAKSLPTVCVLYVNTDDKFIGVRRVAEMARRKAIYGAGERIEPGWAPNRLLGLGSWGR